MATENSDNPPSPELAPSPSTLPDYPKMIMEAIEALNESEGSNESAIAQQIESTHADLADLPPNHASLLSNSLNQMKLSGELVFAKNNYMKPDLNPPPKRGRGRPPKPKVPIPPGVVPVVASPSRPRGRPPKPKDPFFPLPVAKSSISAGSSGSGRPRGRPPKKAKTTPTPSPHTETESTAAPVSNPPRGRGRPPKVKPAVSPVGC